MSNDYIQDNKSGRMSGRTGVYKTPEEFKEAFRAYFADPTVRIIYTKDGPVEAQVMNYDGIAIELGLCGKQGIFDQEKRKGEGWKEAVAEFKSHVRSWWHTYGTVGNQALATWVLSKMDNNPRLGKGMSDVEQADFIVQEAADGNISIDTAAQYIAAIKSKADIRKTSELEDRIKMLEELADVGSA